VDIGTGRQRLWVRKTDGVVVKERVPVVGMESTEVENLLAQHGVQP
jgi:2-keto-3-deoxy-galactonokinase